MAAASRKRSEHDDRQRFIEPLVKELPMEYAVEMNRLIELQMEGSGRLTKSNRNSTSKPRGCTPWVFSQQTRPNELARMPTTLKTTGFTQEAFDSFLASRDEPAWLSDARRAAWQTFQNCRLPSRADEEWMRTDIRLFRLDKFHLPSGQTGGSQRRNAAARPVSAWACSSAAARRLLDSRAVEVDQGLNAALAKKGVLFGGLDELVRTHGDIVRKNLFRAVNLNADKFAALHAACWSGGMLLYVPKGVIIEEPLHSLAALSSGGVDLSHVLVVLEDGAEAHAP